MFKVLVFVISYLVRDCIGLTTNSCNCGYGGVCIVDENGANIPLPCSLCKDVSEGFYAEDCQTIVNHCKTSPCLRGSCQPTFGGFYCKCPNGWTGKLCEIKITDGFVADNEVYVYYQVQPSNVVGTHSFTIVYNIREHLRDELSYVELHILFTDGRVYFPSRSDFVLKNIKEKCIREALNNEDLLDIKVCDYLPNGEVNTFTFDVFFSIAQSVPDSELVKGHDVGLIGRKGRITMKIMLKSSDGRVIRELHKETYLIFSYFYPTAKRCLVESSFVDCSTSVDVPDRYSRESKILIRAVSKISNCVGVFAAGTEWFLQRNINPDDNAIEKDFVPQPIGKNTNHLAFDPFSLSRGLHMFEFAYYFRGTPPYYGGTNSFTEYSRCWIVVTGGEPNLNTEGGSWRTMSCHSQMALPLFNSNPNFKLSDFLVFASCNVTTDNDCERRKLSVPVLRKARIPECETYYEYTLEVQYATYEGVSTTVEKKKNFTTVLHFIKSTVNFYLECLFNCYPIDPSFKLLMYAASRPYFRDPVEWSVMRGETVVEITDKVQVFRPLSASRILRLDGLKLVEDTARASEVFIKTSYGHLGAKVTTIGDNLKYDGAMGYEIEFADDTKQAISIQVKSPGPLTYPVGTYSVFEFNKLAKDLLPLMSTQYKEDLNYIIPHWTSLRICVRDEKHVDHCQEQLVEEGNIELNRDRNMTVIEEAYSYKNVQLFLSSAVLFLIDLLGETNQTYFTWPGHIDERLRIIDLANELDVKGQKEAKSALFLASILFYSEAGNKNESIHPYDEEKDFENVNPEKILKRLNLRYNALKFFDRVMVSLYQESLCCEIKVDLHPAGDLRQFIIRTWSLAHMQGGLSAAFTELGLLKKSHSKDKTFLLGEINFLAKRNRGMLDQILETITKLLSRRSRLYYGIRSFGLKHVRAWSARASYLGVVRLLNKSNDRNELDPALSKYIFGNPSSLGPESEMLIRTKISLPPTPENWGDKEFTFVVVFLESKEGGSSRSPRLTIRLADRHGKAIERIPGEVNITLPHTENGILTSSKGSISKSKDVLVKSRRLPRPLRDFNAYKITMPDSFKDWELVILHNSYASLKAKVFLNSAPDFDETFASPPIVSSVATSNFLSKTKVNIKPQVGNAFLPSHFYLGILPGEEEALPGNVDLRFERSIYLCKIKHFRKKSVYCKGLSKNVIETDDIECQCDSFGTIYAVELTVSVTRIMMEQITLMYPELYNVIMKTIIGIVMMGTMIFAVMGFAYWKDNKRNKKVSLINLEDNYVEDNYGIIIGVYTGMRCLAGAKCIVAIKVIGSTSSSRVHILQKRTQKTLQAGDDDWFMMITNKSLGTIKSIRIWLDFKKRSQWYCDRIFIYDVQFSRWYVVNIRKWLELTDSTEESRFSTFEMREVESIAADVDHSFTKHYLRELSNTHLVASMFLLHTRSLKSFEQLGYVLLIDILSIFCAIWLIEEVAYEWIYDDKYLDSSESEVLIGVTKRAFITAILSALISSIFTLTIRTMHRSIYISRFYQKRTTNPVYLDMMMSAESARSPKKSLFSLGRISFHTIASRKSTKYEIQPWNHKVGFRKLWKVYLTLVVGPCQFRCVNVDRSVFQQRAFWKYFFIRIFVLLIMLGLLAAIVYIVLFTNYWNKIDSALFLTGLAFLMDAFILNPFFILICSCISVFAMKISNSEIYLINEDVRMKYPPVMSYTKYVFTATRKEYKPLLSSEIDASRRKGGRTHTILVIICYAIALTAIVCSVLLLYIRHSNRFYLISSIKLAFSQPSILFNRTVPDINGVHDKPTAADFVISSLAPLDASWYNGKSISKDKHRWGKDRFSRSGGSILVIAIFMANASGFTPSDMADSIIKPPCGYLSDNSQLTEEVEFHGVTLNYFHSSHRTITGRSQEVYHLAGHNETLPTLPWDKYYTSLRLIMDDLTNLRGSCESRAVIFTTNYFNPFINHRITVELLIEFLPMGITSAVVNVRASYVKLRSNLNSAFNISQLLLVSLLLFYTPVFIILASTVGLKILQEHILKCFLLLAYVSVAVMLVFHSVKESVNQAMIDDPTDAFHDINSLYSYDMYHNACLLSIVGIVVLEFSLIMLRVFGTIRLKLTAYKCIRRTGTVFVILLSFNAIIKWCMTMVSVSGASYQILHTKFQGYAAVDFSINGRILLILQSAVFLIMVVLFKLGTAMIMITYCSSDAGDVCWLESYLQKTTGEFRESRRSKKGKAIRKSFHITSSLRHYENVNESRPSKDRLQSKISFMQ